MDLLAWEDADSESLEGLLGTSGYGVCVFMVGKMDNNNFEVCLVFGGCMNSI